LEDRRFGERLGAPGALIYGTGKEIVAGDHGAYPKKFGKWRDSLNRTVVGSFGIQVESYSVRLVEIRLCCGQVVFSGLTLFGQNCRMNRSEIARQNKARQIWRIKTDEEQNYRNDKTFG
jgi:hypothetical protein